MLAIISVLAIWRITSILYREEGPYEIFLKLRRRLNEKGKIKVFSCFWCLSVWVSIPFSIFTGHIILSIFAYSAGAIIIDEIMETIDNVRKM